MGGPICKFLDLDWASMFGIEERPPSSASAALDMTAHMIVHKMSMGPLVGGIWISRCRGFGGIMGATAKIVKTSGAGLCFGDTEVGRIAVDPKDHVAGIVSNDGIAIRYTVVEQLGDSLHGSGSAVCLLGGNGTKGGEHGGINSMCA